MSDVIQEVTTNKCPSCLRERAEGEKCGCELVAILKIDYPSDGFGVFTYLSGYKYPYAGFADQNIVDLNAVVKRTLISSIFLILKRPIIYSLFVLFWFKEKAIRQYCVWFSGVVDAAFKGYGSSQTKYPKPLTRFSKPVREIIRTAEKFIGEDLVWRQCVMGFAMALEYDNAYRFRVQDIFSNLDKSNLKNNYRKEVVRLLKLGIERECLGKEPPSPKKGDKSNNLVEKWSRTLLLIRLSLYVYPRMSKLIKDFLLELNPEELKPTDGDWYYMSERWDYNFGGISFKERLAKKNAEDREWRKNNPQTPTPIADNKPYIGLVPSENFWNLSHEEAVKTIDNLKENFLKEFDARKLKV